MDQSMQTIQTITSFATMGLIFIIFYFLMYRPQKKREKETADMRNALEVGDEIITAGGIVGTVVSIKDDTILIETGSDRNKIRIIRAAVQVNNTPHTKTNSK